MQSGCDAEPPGSNIMDLTDVMAEELQTPFVDLSVAMIFRKL